MPAPQRVSSAFVIADTTLITTAETVAVTLAGISTQDIAAPVVLDGWLQVTLGTGTTAVTLRVRQVSLTGALVGEANAEQIFTAAASTESHAIQVTDRPGEVAGLTYVLTIAQTGASANGTVVQARLSAVVGN